MDWLKILLCNLMLWFPRFALIRNFIQLFKFVTIKVHLTEISINWFSPLRSFKFFHSLITLNILITAIFNLAFFEVFREKIIDISQDIFISGIKLFIRLPRNYALISDTEYAIWGNIDLQVCSWICLPVPKATVNRILCIWKHFI